MQSPGLGRKAWSVGGTRRPRRRRSPPALRALQQARTPRRCWPVTRQHHISSIQRPRRRNTGCHTSRAGPTARVIRTLIGTNSGALPPGTQRSQGACTAQRKRRYRRAPGDGTERRQSAAGEVGRGCPHGTQPWLQCHGGKYAGRKEPDDSSMTYIYRGHTWCRRRSARCSPGSWAARSPACRGSIF